MTGSTMALEQITYEPDTPPFHPTWDVAAQDCPFYVQEELKSWNVSGFHFWPEKFFEIKVFDFDNLQYLADAETKAEFEKLLPEWKDATWHLSMVKKKISHPAYLRIIGLGKPVVSLIIDELRKSPDHWAWALEAIVRHNPAPHATSIGELNAAWLEWGTQHGL